jgi:hypothetical protein
MVLVATAPCTSYLPDRRAAVIDPFRTLHWE